MTTHIEVSVSIDTRHRLQPRYDRESDILAVQSEVDVEWPFGVDIYQDIVFDLDSSRSLVNFAVHVPMSLWERRALEARPEAMTTGSIVFAQQSVTRKSFHLPYRLLYDDAQRLLFLEIGGESGTWPAAAEVHRVALSDRCLALVARQRLAGFLVRLG